ncbi:MAG: hypothetical protein KGH98_03585 [Candidatus Micrarchaeota archaeon]|nr:hypothetical protein [Candidatus Micrarchaeota archaeon]
MVLLLLVGTGYVAALTAPTFSYAQDVAMQQSGTTCPPDGTVTTPVQVCTDTRTSAVTTSYVLTVCTGYSQGIKGIGGGGRCIAYQTIATYAGSGSLSNQTAAPQPTPLLDNVIKFNANSAANLIACPASPSSFVSYFNSYEGSYIGGDRCLAPVSSLTSTVVYQVTLIVGASPNDSGVASAGYPTVTVENPGRASLFNLGYSGQSFDPLTGNYSISDTHDTGRYIFQGSAGTTQYNVWGWYANYADLGNASLSGMSQGHNYVVPDKSKAMCSTGISFSESSSLEQISNAGAPIPQSLSSGTGYQNTTVVPDLIDYVSIPVVYSDVSNRVSNLNLNLDVYSPHNFLNATGYLDPFPIYTDSAFFANYSGTFTDIPVSIGNIKQISSGLLSQLQKLLAGGGSLISSFYGQSSPVQISGPTDVVATPDDHIYVLSSKSSLFGFGPSTFYLSTLRFIPTGDYIDGQTRPGDLYASGMCDPKYNDPTSTAPQCPETIYNSTAHQWVNSWHSYWSNLIPLQQHNIYMSAQTPITGFSPISIAADYAGDVFVFGCVGKPDCTSGVLYAQAGGQHASINMTQPSDFSVSSSSYEDFAASAGGQYLYLASPGNGEVVIYRYNGFPSGSGNGAAGVMAYSGTMNLTYRQGSNSTQQLNLTQYMADGGPFNDSAVAAAYASAGYTPDSASNHHPIALVESQGLLYVLDNWTFTVHGMPASVLMLRAFGAGGTEAQINSLQGTSHQNNLSIAYGWPIAANISIGNGQYETYCAAGCTYTTKSIQGTKLEQEYAPVGPFMSDASPGWFFGLGGSTSHVGGSPLDVALYSDFNGTSYLLAHAMCNGGFLNLFSQSCNYTELTTLSLSLQNYTAQNNGAYAPYSCMLSSDQNPSGTTCSDAGSSIDKLYPPVVGVPSPFSYAESLGSPGEYFQAGSALSSLFPTPLNQTQALKQAPTGCTGGAQCPQSNSTQTLAQLAIGQNQTYAGSKASTYLNTTISGDILVPYTYRWTYSSYTEYTPGPKWNSRKCGQPPQPISEQEYYVYYGTLKIPVSSSYNSSVNGGYTYPTYPAYGGSSLLYQANLSDENLIIPPAVNFQIYSNRLFGEAYVNQSVRASGPLANPLVINASRYLDYAQRTVSISFSAGYREGILGAQSGLQFGGVVPGYSVQQGIALSPQQTGVSCSECKAAGYYYNSSRAYPGNSTIAYTQERNSTVEQLADLYRLESYAYSLDLNLSGSPQALGYNRLLYTYVDPFNNTISMPLSVDLARQTSLGINSQAATSPTNPNESTISVNGTLGYYSGANGTYTPLAGSKVYLYYGQDINYYNATAQPGSPGYYKYATLCAFESTISGCALADPLATITQGATGVAQAEQLTFHTQYNSSTNQTCAPEPKSLLNTSSLNQCNIFGRYGLPATRPLPSDPSATEYCQPDSQNGNGIFTSQIGLVSILNTDKSGNFDAKFNVCGTGSTAVTAKFYGSPGPEPTIVRQPAMSSSNLADSKTAAQLQTYEYNYQYAPGEATTSFNFGSYALGFGDVDAAFAVAAISAAMLPYLFRHKRRAGRSV